MNIYQPFSGPTISLSAGEALLTLVPDHRHTNGHLFLMRDLMSVSTATGNTQYSFNPSTKGSRVSSFVLPPDSKNIRLSEGETVMQRLSKFHVKGENIAHLSHDLPVGERLVMSVEKTSHRLQSAPSFQIGFTQCDLTDANKIVQHRKSCGSHSVCQKSFAQTISQYANEGSVVTIIRTRDSIQIEVLKNREVRCYSMKKSTLPKETASFVPPNQVLYPFVVLSGVADRIRILDSQPESPLSPTPSEIGMDEAAERLIQGLVADSPVKIRPDDCFKNSAPAPVSSWASLLKTGQKTFTSAIAARIPHNYRFYPLPYGGDNIQISQEGRVVRIKSQSGSRMAYISRPFTVDMILAFKVEKEAANYITCSHSFVVGLTSCDRESVLKYSTHSDAFCNSSRPCAGTCGYHSIPSNAHKDSIVYMQRQESMVTITICSKQGWRVESLKIPDPFVNTDCYPMIEMSGAAEIISITDVMSVPAVTYHPKNSTSSPRFAISVPRNESHFSSSSDWEDDEDMDYEIGDDKSITFWPLPYAGNGVEISNNNMKVRRTARIGARHVYFNREIEIGVSVKLKVTQGAGKLAPFRFEFGFTCCSRKAVRTQKVHMIDICSRTNCKGFSQTVGLKYDPHLVSHIIITRKRDMFVVDQGSGANHKRFFRHLPDGYTDADRWFPLITLTGDVEAVEIVDCWRNSPRRVSSASLPTERIVRLQSVNEQTHDAGDAGEVYSPVSSLSPPADSPVPQFELRDHQMPVPAKCEDSFERMHFSNRFVSQRPKMCELSSSGEETWYSNDSRNFRELTGFTNIPTNSPSPLQFGNQIHAPQKVSNGGNFEIRSKENQVSHVSFPNRKWYNNPVIVFRDQVIARIDNSQDARGYIFSHKLQLNEEIGFRIPVDGRSAQLAFGVTTVPLLRVDVSKLPINAADLMHLPEWYVYPNLARCFGVEDGLILTRTSTGISLKLFHDRDTEHEIISGIDSNETVFPFFHLTGCQVQILADV